MPYMIQTNHLSKTIGGKELVTDVNLHVKKGEIYGFLGPNDADQSLEAYGRQCGTVRGDAYATVLRGAETDGEHHRVSDLL